MNLIKITTTTPDHATAVTIASSLIDSRQAACVQISGPIDSIYMWDDATQYDEEYQVSIKTVAERYDEIERTITELHPYDVPQIIATQISHSSSAYADWVNKSVAE